MNFIIHPRIVGPQYGTWFMSVCWNPKFQAVFLGSFAKLRNAIISFFMSVRPHGTTRLPLDGFSWNLIFEDFSKLFRENLSFIKIRREEWVLYM
jgi:hypothetical protein